LRTGSATHTTTTPSQSGPYDAAVLGCASVRHGARRAALLVVAAALAALAVAPYARADGDPASDVLPEQPVFYGSAVDLKSKPAAQLDALVRESRRRGYPVNVVVITRLEDMGSANYLFDDPDNYGDFLAGEIACCVTGRVLIVMPGGLGVTYIGHSSRADRRVVARLPAPGTVENLLPAAIDGVRRLAAASGVQLAVPDATPAPGGVRQPATHVSAPPIATPGAKSGGARGGGASGAKWLGLVPIVVVTALALAALGRRAIRAGGRT
jgi:hypothetical protein